ncbi:Outer membrane protein [Minicystis rosea]|nr:Outer membrane protein [Minicystis rosea]
MTRTLPFLGLTLALGSVACTLPKYYAPHPCDRPDLAGCVIEEVSVAGAQKVPAADVKEKIATAESSHTLGGLLENVPILSLWDRITVDYEQFDPFVLERDLARVERLYRARGYYEAHARAARVRKTGKERVSVEIVVDEGEPVNIGVVRMDWEGKDKPSTAVLNATRRAIRPLQRGTPFAEQALEDAKKKVLRAMTDNGFAYATVDGKATVDLVEHRAQIIFTANPGPPTTFGPVRIEGAGDLPEARLRQAINITEGDPYAISKLESAQAALADLRVLGSVDFSPELSTDPEHRVTKVPIVFRVTQTPLHTTKAGFGVELGNRVGVHGVAGWENRNFLGGLRTFQIEGKPGVVFFPLTLTTLFNGAPTEFHVVPELRLHSALTQPGFLEARTKGLLSVDFNVYQLTSTSTLGYLEVAGKTGMARDLWGGRVQLALNFNVQFDQPLKLQIPDPCLLSTGGGYNRLVLPYIQSVATLDLRRGANGKPDPANPHSGVYLSNDVQIAWGSSRDIRVRPEVRGYIPVSRRVTLAMRLAGGFLYAFGGDLKNEPLGDYEPVIEDKQSGCPKQIAGDGDTVTRNRWTQVLQLRGFTSGGTNSNRGYAFNGVGPQAEVPGISPQTSTGALLPIATGGKALWEATVELRFPVYDKLGMVVFVDGSDVRQNVADFGAPFAPHLSTGIGFRYATPVGPLRADIGVRIPGAQVMGSTCPIYDPSSGTRAEATCNPLTGTTGKYLDPTYGQAGAIRGVVPLAISLQIGEAF